jgi:uncharacterized membrane protein (DUF4010 family)
VVSALSFTGFIAMRLLGENKGLLVAGLVGGMVSSTGVTVAMAQRSRENPVLARSAAVAAILASAVMGLRVLLFVAAYGAAILPRLAPAVLVMALVSGAVAAVVNRKAETGVPAVAPAPMTNPFSLRAALGFAVLYAVVLLLVPAARAWLGTAGSFVAAAVTALLDVDAMTIAFARAAPADGPWREAAAAITLGVTTNTLVKAGIVAVMARGPFRRWVITGLALAAIACAGAGAAIYLGSA